MNEIKPDISKQAAQADAWSSLRSFTAARIALGRTGVSIPLKESLQFTLAHAHARDAVYSLLNIETLINELQQFDVPILHLHSLAKDRYQYLQRPDYGRKLNEISSDYLNQFSNHQYDIAISIADGLSAIAVNQHIIELLSELIPLLQQINLSIAPFCLTEQGRVAISDEIASSLNAKLSLIFIGERPGLSSQDSLGAYLTYDPVVGKTDECRNCVSNIRPQGLSYSLAAKKIFYLINESMRMKLSGVGLKDYAINKLH